MSDGPYRHPLAAVLAHLGLTATEYLVLVDRRHRELGYGAMAVRREKVTRWQSGVSIPEPTAQLAMASLHGVSPRAVTEHGWPDWLLLAFPDDRAFLDAPWTAAGTVTSLAASARGGSMDRRGFLIASGTTLGALALDWAGALGESPAASAAGRRRLTVGMVARLEQRLDDLRHLDDVLGGGELRKIAAAELRMVTSLAHETIYDGAAGRRLFATVCEAARLCGWQHFDAGLHAAAQRYFVTALRASATAGDAEIGANVLAFMAIQTYSVGDPVDAVTLLQTALSQAKGHTTARVMAMLHVRHARALSKTPHGKTACLAELHAARQRFAAGPHDDDPLWSYWMTEGELEMLAASCALDLGDPRRALTFFEAAKTAGYAADSSVRDNALYLTRTAEAHLALSDIEQACAIALQAVELSGGVDSTRPSGAIIGFRKRLGPHRKIPAARQFLEATA
ncbi:hypothetical protein [Acrocarpospora catenulata]|uniref:hypothetical protein n=1 Tax=Acrocarpospora catenulata TaxID=2836182 RepID=UPI001BDA6DB8|nr:hypothetical protein [Acrocarpospora catenulata]